MMHRVRASDRGELERLVDQQRTHPPVAGLPIAARILDLPLFIGDAQAATDPQFLSANRITHVVSLGTGRISPERCSVLTVDVLDMEDQLILLHFRECIKFIRDALRDPTNAVLVHCVYGQSRSASICVAFLMAERNMPMTAAYDTVHGARPCIHINPGFLMQLQLFQRMRNDANLLGASNAHAELRALLAAQEWTGSGTVQLRDVAMAPGPAFSCSKCNCYLASIASEVHAVPTVAAAERRCAAIFIEPLKWMGSRPSDGVDFGYQKEGKLSCPKCAAKVGSWTWIGTKCQCGQFVAPAFQLIPSRIRRR